MTAFASHEVKENGLSIAVEIRSFNSRHLDMVLRLSSGYTVLEEKIKHQIQSSVTRGRVETRIHIKDETRDADGFDVDIERAKSYLTAVDHLKTTFNLTSTLSVDHLLTVTGIIQSVENTPDAESYWPHITKCLGEALTDLDRMRRAEGDYILNDFKDRLAFIDKSITEIETATDNVVSAYREKLEARIAALTQGVVELDKARITQEAAMLADRSDISEEIVRARSHLEQFRTLINSEEAAGRKLNFLLQELNREFNTMGAKVGQAAVAHVIVDVKAELEKLREQIQNIE
jgi:uncharacterized protein (TIGR00255 family)